MSISRLSLIRRETLLSVAFVSLLLSVLLPYPVFATSLFDSPPGAWLLPMPFLRIEFVIATFALNFFFLQVFGIKQIVRKLYLSILLTWSGYLGYIVCYGWISVYTSILSGQFLAHTIGRDGAGWLCSGLDLQVGMFIGMLIFSLFIQEEVGTKTPLRKRLLISLAPSLILSIACLGLVGLSLNYWSDQFYHYVESTMLNELLFLAATILLAICLWTFRHLRVTAKSAP